MPPKNNPAPGVDRGGVEVQQSTASTVVSIIHQTQHDEQEQDAAIDVVGTQWPLLPLGKYSVVLEHHETALSWGRRAAVYLHFRVVDPGDYFGVKLFRAYRVAELIGKPKRNGRFTLRRRSELHLTLCRLLERARRVDRVSLSFLKNTVLKVNVRHVTTDYRQRELPMSERYSVVDAILEVETGNVSANSCH
jgi:hypothetical protein